MQANRYSKARFFKCALQVNPVNYLQYRGQAQSLSEFEYNQQLLNAALKVGVEVIGLANHGCVNSVDAIKSLFNQHGIVVFPGFEIASSEKIHFVCLFEENKSKQELERILGSLDLFNPQNGVQPSRLSAQQLIDKVNQQGGFIYAAHCTNDNGLPNIELYGQNEIYEMTRDEQGRNQLIKRFLKGEHEQLDVNIAKLYAKLKENSESIIKALSRKEDIDAEVERLPKLLNQAGEYQTLGIDEKLQMIPKLEKEKQLDERVNEEVDRVKMAVETLKDSLPDPLFLSESALEGLPNADLLTQERDILNTLTSDLHQTLAHLEQLILNANTQLLPIKKGLVAKQHTEEQGLEKTFKDIPTSQGKTGREIGIEYQELLKQIERIRPKQTAMQNWQSLIDELDNQRKALLLELDKLTSERASSMQQSVKRLMRKLQQKVKLTLQPEGNRQALVNFLSACNLEGIGPKRLAWVLDGKFSPAKLAATIRQGHASLIDSFDISDFIAEALLRLPKQKLLALEELHLPDTMTIELNVAKAKEDARFKAIDDLSTGQQCTALLHLLLLDNQDPLILDQPEDNLDNAFIAERIVSELRRAKLGRQFLFATHNANIPVFGDAEWIGVLSVENNKGTIMPDQQGAIDVPKVQELAANILEGGKIAFNQRREKYGY